MNKLQQLEAKNQQLLKSLETSTLIYSIKAIGGGKVDEYEMKVRADLLKEYELREGEEKTDALMDEIGM